MKYDYLLEDGSFFSVPAPWRVAYERRFRDVAPEVLEARLRFLVQKYVTHRAVPSKFDGIGVERPGDEIYDDPDFYFERWDDPSSREHRLEPPSMAEIAEGVLYQQLRSDLMLQALETYAAEHGTTPVRVLTPQTFLEQLGPAPDEG